MSVDLPIKTAPVPLFYGGLCARDVHDDALLEVQDTLSSKQRETALLRSKSNGLNVMLWLLSNTL